jgi:hypothetical protein
MKIRNGFVANSSSSSFLAIGWSFWNTRDFVMKILDHIINSKELSDKLGITDFDQRQDNPELEYYDSIDDYLVDIFEDGDISSIIDEELGIELLKGPDESVHLAVELNVVENPSHFVNEVIRKKELIDAAIENNEIIKYLASCEPPYVINECWSDS